MAHKSNNIKGARKDLLLQRRWIVPTLPSEPTTSTWAWNDNGYTVYFRIGEQVRVVDGEQSSGYQFWKLYDIKPNGDRIWAPINSCAVSIHIFRVIENSMGSGETAVGSAMINISCPDDDRNLSFLWQGQDVSYYLKKNVRYTCTPSPSGSFTTPTSFSFSTNNADPLVVVHEIHYNYRSEIVNIKLERTNDTDIQTVPVSIISENGALVTKNISTSGDNIYTMLGSVLFGKTYHIYVGGSTFCWSGTLFSTLSTTERTASTNTYNVSLPFTDERIDVIVKHTTSNGEVFFDSEDVEEYSGKSIKIMDILSKNSKYYETTINEDIYPHRSGSQYLSKITAISSDPRNTASIQYNIAKYLLPGNYTFVCSTSFAAFTGTYYNTGSYTLVYPQFYQLQSPITKELTEEDNVIEFKWNLIYTLLTVSSSSAETSWIRVRKTSSGASMDISKAPTGRTASFGMISVPGDYSISFAPIPYTYKGVDTQLTCENISISPTIQSSKKYHVNGGAYSYTHTYCWDYSYSVDGRDVTINIVTDRDQFGETLPSNYIHNLNVDQWSRTIARFSVKYIYGNWEEHVLGEQIRISILDFDSDNSCTFHHTVEGAYPDSVNILKIKEVVLEAATSYYGGGTRTDENGKLYYIMVTDR